MEEGMLSFKFYLIAHALLLNLEHERICSKFRQLTFAVSFIAISLHSPNQTKWIKFIHQIIKKNVAQKYLFFA